MVKVTQQEDTSATLSTGKELYQCEECGFHYAKKVLAEKCEIWCREHRSCNIAITAHAEENKT